MTEDFGGEGFSVADMMDDEKEGTVAMEVDSDNTTKNSADNSNKNDAKSSLKSSGVQIVDESAADSEESKMRKEIMKKLNFKGSDEEFQKSLKNDESLRAKFDELSKAKKEKKKEKLIQDIEFLPNLRENESNESEDEKHNIVKSESTTDASQKESASATKSIAEVSSVKSKIDLEDDSPKLSPEKVVTTPKSSNPASRNSTISKNTETEKHTEKKNSTNISRKVTWNRDFADLKTYDFNGLVSGVKLIQ